MLAQKGADSTGTAPAFADTSQTLEPESRIYPAPADSTLCQRRLAPRSSNQFRVGPPFSATTPGYRLINSSRQLANPQISARLDRGFDMIEGEWIGYKRNYFTLVAAFKFADLPQSATSTDSFLYIDENGETRPVLAFKILLTSVCLEDNTTAVTLVQHTAKRDRGPQSSPPLYYAVPGELPEHNTMKLVANIRNGDKIDRCNRLFYLLKEDHQQAVAANPHCVLATYPPDCEISLVARYERIQFLSAGCGNRKLASTNNKHYVLVVQLLGVTELALHVVLASSQLPPLIVRGRSPSNYPLTEKTKEKVERTGRPSIASLVVHEDAQNTQNQGKRTGIQVDAYAESQVNSYAEHNAERDAGGLAGPKKRKTKAQFGLSRPPLGPNQNILNSYTAEALDPVLLDSPRCEAPILKGPSKPIPQILPPLDDRLFLSGFGYTPPMAMNPGFIIPQESILPPVEDSPTFHSSFLLMSDGEPMNINHTPFQSSQEKLQHSMQEHKRMAFDIDDFYDPGFNPLYECYLSLPVPIAFPETMRTSTPLQLQVSKRPMVMQPNIRRNLHPPITRCKHGFKQRDKTSRTSYGNNRVYTYADLSDSVAADSSFRIFKDKLNSYKPLIRILTSQPPSLRLSPLTMLSSDHEALILNEIRESSENEVPNLF